MIREAVLRELKKSKRTRYWLAQQLGIQRQSLYRMLDNGEQGFSTNTADEMLRILGLHIKPRRRSATRHEA